MLICNGFRTYETLKMMEFCFENNIILCRLLSYTSHKLQPCDVLVFSSLKTAYRDQVERLYCSSVTVVNKEHFTSLYDPARTAAMTKKNILAGWAKAGLFPFNLDRVIRGITKPAVPQPIRTAYKDQVPL
jgi:DDE superfamily endonuclease